MARANESGLDSEDNILAHGTGTEVGNAARQRASTRRRSTRLPFAGLLAALVLALLTCLAPAAESAVIAIDYGAQWFKVSLVKPGVPLEIVLNRESKRKTRSIVALRDGKRTFDTEAVNLGGRFPRVTYDTLKNVLGKQFDDPVCEAYRSTFDNNMVKTERGTVAFKHPDGTEYPVEQLIAMQFKHAKELADIMAGDAVRDTVITIPRFFNQYERQALLDAAELAGLRVLALLHDDFAVALNFAMTRNFNDTTPEYHIFYDMGAGSTVASLISFQNVPADPRLPKKTIPQLEVKSVGFDKTLGGHEFDLRLQKLLAQQFDAKSGSSGAIYKNQRSMMKLLTQANKVKEILSANTEIGVSVESLMDDVDFKSKVTRAEFDELCKDLVERVTGPVKSVVERAGLTMDSVSSLILVGGSTRIPAVQSALRDLVGEEKIAKNVNSDEAAVMGAGFRGAGISRQFKVRDIRVKDINVFPVEIGYAAEAKEGKEERTINTLLFAENAVLPSRKLMTFRRNTDFTFGVAYRAVEGKEVPLPARFLEAEVPGVADAIASFKGNESVKIVGEPKVKATIALSESGLVNVVDAGVYFDIEVSKSLKDRVMSFFGGKSDNSTATNSTDEAPAPDGTGPGPLSEAKDSNDTAPAPKTEMKQERIALNITVQAAGIVPMDTPAKTKALAKLLAMDAEDRTIFQLAEARNQLESFTYSLREFLGDDETAKCSTEAEREKLATRLSETSEWFYGDGENADLTAVKGKLQDLKDLKAPIELRKKEKKTRPDAVAGLKKAVDAAKTWVSSTQARNKESEEKYKKDLEAFEAKESAASASPTPEPEPEKPAEAAEGTNATNTTSSTTSTPTPPKPFIPIHTPEEFAALLSLASTQLSWLDSKVAEQDKLPEHADPVLLTRELEKRTEEIKDEMVRLMRRKRPLPPKVKPTTSVEKEKVKETPVVINEEPVVEKPEEPKTEEPKVEEPKVEEPVKDEL